MVLKARVPCWIGFLAMWPAMPTAADKQGFYIGAGISAATYRISTDLDSGMKGSRVAGGRLEAGHVWDVGRAGTHAGHRIALEGNGSQGGFTKSFDRHGLFQ